MQNLLSLSNDNNYNNYVNPLTHLQNQLKLSVAQRSLAGIKKDNEDAIGIRIPEGHMLATKGAVAVIADGVSAADGGKEASETAVTGFLSDYYSTPDTWSVKQSGVKVLTALNRWLFGQGQQLIAAEKGYITTFSCLILKSSTAHILHVGDSRIYRLRQGQLEQLTRDHATPVRNGHRYLARALGIDLKLNVDYRQEPLQGGDLFIATTDGIHDFISNQDIKANLASDDLESACQTMTQLALEKGSDDNISIQCIRVDQAADQNSDEAIASLANIPFPPDLEVGQKIDHWRVVKVLQASQRSQVYQVEHDDGRQAVMKTPSVNYKDDTAYIERFVMEEWIGSRISSPHVVKTLAATRQRKFLYYLTEFVPGPTLGELIKQRGKLEVSDAIDIITQVISGIRAFHRKETLHQDIKPDNIVYSQNGVKIIDFGSALVAGIDEIQVPLTQGNQGIVRETALGTLDYSAPEYRLQGPRTERSDQYAIGTLLYEMLTGHLPYGKAFERASNPRDFQRLTYHSALEHNPLVPAWIDGAIRKAVNLTPEYRYESLSEFIHDLNNPNPKYTGHLHTPLLERNPLVFWKFLALGALAAHGFWLWWFFSR